MKKYAQANMLLFITAALFLAVSIGLSVLIGVFGMAIPAPVSLLTGQVIIIIPSIIYMAVKKIPFKQTVRMKKTNPVNFVMALLVILFSYPVVVVLNIFSMFFVDNAVAGTMTDMMSEMNIFFVFFAVAVMPAFGEEILFRGVMYNTYSQFRPAMGLVISAAAFGMMHGNFNQMPYAAFLGVVFVLMLEASDSIWVTMFMHFLLNGSNVLMMYLTPENLLEQSSQISIRDMFGTFYAMGGMPMIGIIAMVYLCIGLAFAGIVFLLIWLTFKMNHRSIKECFRKKNCTDVSQHIQSQMNMLPVMNQPQNMNISQAMNQTQCVNMSHTMNPSQNITMSQTTVYGEKNKKFASASKEKMLDWWLFGFLLIIIAEIVIDMIL